MEQVHDITETEFKTYVAAIATYRALTERTTYTLLRRDSQALADTLAAISNVEQVSGSFRRVNTQVLGVTLTGELLNWLTAGTLYFVSTVNFLQGQFGNSSDQLRRFRDGLSRASKACPGYRLMLLLRDYAQHAASPLSGLSVSRDDARPRKVEIYVLKSELLSSPGYTWEGRDRKLLETLPEQIALMPLVIDAMQGYAMIEDEVFRILLDAAIAAIPTLRDGIARVAPQPGQHPAILGFEDRADDVEGIRLWSFPDLADLNRLQTAADSPDPVASLRRPAQTKPARKPDMLNADREAASIVSVWLDHDGGSPELQRAVDSAVAGAGASTLVAGLVNLSAYLSAMLATLVGSTPQALIGAFTNDAESDGDG
jgi:hypothetical protein